MPSVEESVAAFERAKLSINTFCAEHSEIMSEYTLLAEVYNSTRARAHAAIKSMKGKEPKRFGDFKRGAGRESKGFNPSKLPIEVLAIPGVVSKVSTTYIEELVEIGKVKESAVKAARTSKDVNGNTSAPKDLRPTP